ncbi:MAG TPA: hypothetical protein VLT45_04110 [Kofleriaceae bacterium]|nr:hypothetical protein [Kofleriaceae bacterium]
MEYREPRRDVLLLDTRNTPLPRAMLDVYHADLRGWIAELCRTAGDGPALGLIDALYGERTMLPGAFARWDAIGPHAELRRQFNLSRDALAILLVAAAPRLWGPLAHVYAAVTGRVHTDEHMLAQLLGDRAAIVRELAAGSPLLAFKLLARTPTGNLVASAEVVSRLAGTCL